MKHKVSSNEFEAVIDNEGKITVPADVAKRLAGVRLHVRLQRGEISATLVRKEVTEKEIERIAAVQLESREQVVTFLMSEGSLKDSRTFMRRAKSMYGGARGRRR